MDKHDDLVARLFEIRNQHGPVFWAEKTELLKTLVAENVKGTNALKQYYDVLLFIMAYPDNKLVYELASSNLQKLEAFINKNPGVQSRLFNSGITGSSVLGAFGFEMTKWLRNKYKKNVWIDSRVADDGQMLSVIAAVLPKVESEILQDANTNWKLWLKKTSKKGEELLDTLIRIFDHSDMRPEVKDELWGALGTNVEVKLISHAAIPLSLCDMYYHRSAITKSASLKLWNEKPVKVNLKEDEAEKILECGRMILVRHIREIDPVTFSDPKLISYYKLSRGLSIALLAMTDDRRQPIDSYMGYVAFKNGLPVAYAGSWMLFDSGRIGLNIFSSYRGGESVHVFGQILDAHRQAYHLKRFSVDPYQIGKDNSDGIKSGAFWLYYKLGFRPVRKVQRDLAEAEAIKLKTINGYRSPSFVLKKLADSKLELIISGKPVRFDVADLSLVYANILKKHYNSDRKTAERTALNALVKILKPGPYDGNERLKYVLKNWCVILMTQKHTIQSNKALKDTLNKLFKLKADGDEDEYIRQLQKCEPLKKLIQEIVKENQEVILK